MSWILSLNKFILVPVITDWSKCDDILMLDTALCNHTDREYYQSLMSEYSEKYLKVVLEGLTVNLSPILCDWLAARFSENFPVYCLKSLTLKVQERSLNVYGDLDQTTGDRVMTFLAPIESLEIIRCEKYNQELCESLFPLLHNITKFAVTINCCAKSSIHTGRLLEAAAQNFSNLRTFHLEGCDHVSDLMLSSFVRQCKHLIELKVRDCLWLHGSFLLTLITTKSQIGILDLLDNWESSYLLQYLLCAKGIEISLWATASIFRTLIWYWGSNLRSVNNLRSLEGVNSQLMNEMLDCCPSLTKLEIAIINWDIDIDVQQRLAIAWKQLTVLVMAIWEIEDILILVNLVCTYCTVLQELNMMLNNYHSSLTIPGCQFHCHNLEKLTLRCSLTDEMLLGMLSQSRKFRALNIFGCGTFATIANIALVVPYLYNLEEFDIRNLKLKAFNCILRNCSNLKVLHVPSNFKLPSDGSVLLPSLTTLKVGPHCVDGVWLICPNLKELITSNVSQALAMRLVEHLPRLKVLICRGLIDWRSEKCIRTSKLKIN